MNIEGIKINHLKVLKKLNKDKNRHDVYLCECVCGKIFNVVKNNILSGNTKSCGCMKCFKHGHSKKGQHSNTYRSYADMKSRCYNEKTRNYKNYGGRGIFVCDEWNKRDGFLNFLNDMGECPEGYTLERIDVNKGYQKENCCWIPKNLQHSNKRNSVKITFNGVTKTESEWAKHLNIPKSTLRKRRLKNWPLEMYLSKPNTFKNIKELKA